MKKIICVFAFAIFGAVASAEEPIKINCASDRTVRVLSERAAKVQETTKLKIDVSKYESKIAIKNLVDDKIDGFVGPRIWSAVRDLEASGQVPKQNESDYDETALFEAKYYFGIPKSNKVADLTEEQFAKILDGTIKNWNQLGGPNSEIVLFTNLDFSIVNTLIDKKFFTKSKMQVNPVKGLSGQGLALKKNPNGIIVVNEKPETLEGIPMRYFFSGISTDLVLHMKKKARPSMQLVMQEFKKMGKTEY